MQKKIWILTTAFNLQYIVNVFNCTIGLIRIIRKQNLSIEGSGFVIKWRM